MTFLDDAPIAILLTNKDFKITYANAAACILFKKDTTQLLGALLPSFIKANDQQRFDCMLEDPETIPLTEGKLQISSSEDINICLQVSSVSNEYCWYIENKTQITKLQNKLSSLKRLPREYGHDINNLLTVILSAAQI